MKLTKLTIKDLITPEAKLTFLVGAGCSVDPPSCLPTGRTMMNSIIDYTCAESEIDKIKKLEELRFEALVEVVRDNLDPDLRLIDFYGQCDKPNIQHLFLADMTKKGNFVITTNFDFLIEYALLQSNITKDKIICVITKDDFENFSNPYEIYSQGKMPIYKIHGSTKNIIEDKSTRKSLIATIQAFGSNKEGLNVFQLEPFKQPLFDNISKGRSLVVIGYSGNDDFDIIPTLKVLKDLRSLVWINFIENDGGKEKIYEFDKTYNHSFENTEKINQLLKIFQKRGNAEYIYRVDANTTRLIQDISDFKYIISENSFYLNPRVWLEEKIETPSIFMKLYIPYKIYYDFNRYNDALRCMQKIHNIAEKIGDREWSYIACNNMGVIYQNQGNVSKALEQFEYVLQNAEMLGDLKGRATQLINIGSIYEVQGNYEEALKQFDKALQINEQLGNLKGCSSLFNNIGRIYKAQKKYPEALNLYKRALETNEQLLNFKGIAIQLNNIGRIYEDQNMFSKALVNFEKALEIDENIGDLNGKAIRLNNIGNIYKARFENHKALNFYEQSLQILINLGLDKSQLAELVKVNIKYIKSLK